MADSNVNEIQQALAVLRLHEQRRGDALPTLSVLVGSVAAATSLWRHWGAEAGYRPAIRPCRSVGQIVSTLIEHARASCDLPRLALNALLQRVGKPATASTSPLNPALDGRTLLDLDTLAESALPLPDPTGTAAVAHEICRLALIGRIASADLIERLDSRLADRIDHPYLRVLRAIDELLPVGACPAVLLTEPTSCLHDEVDNACDSAPFETVPSWLAHLAQAVPGWPVGLILSPGKLEVYRGTAADSQTKSLLLTGVILLRSRADRQDARGQRTAGTLTSLTTRNGVGPHDSAVDANLLAAGAKAARAREASLDAAADAARSDAEQLLFEMLESNPTTRGHFVLNGAPGFKFGTRQAEVDLLSSGLRLAVEIDGYHHFTNPDSYRRDRRKDWLLQSHGYTVVRVLAEDVSGKMENVLDFVVNAVEGCRRNAL